MSRRAILGAFATWLGLTAVALAQSAGVRAVVLDRLPNPGFTPSCSQSSSFLARASDVTLKADKTNYDNLICGLVTDGVWSKLDALYIFAAVDRTTAVLNLVQSTYNSTEVGTVNFSAYVGYTGDNSTFAIDTNLNPSTAVGAQYALNSASYGVYIQTSRSDNVAYCDMGANDGTASSRIFPQGTGGNMSYSVNAIATVSNANANSQGFWALVRNASSTTTNSFKNGSSFSTDAQGSSALPTVTFQVFSDHRGNLTFDQASAAFIGGALSSTDVSHLSTRINTYMTAYSINVY